MLTENQILILFVSFTFGAVLRTLWGYLWQYLKSKEEEFDRRYILTMLISIVLSLIFATVSFSGQEIPDTWEPTHVFAYISIGFTVNTLFNSPVSYLIEKKKL